MGIISIIQKDWQRSFDIYDELARESNWSKAVYTYLKALALYMMAQDKDGEEQSKMIKQVHDIMKQVNGAKQKIAGKSIPMEVKYPLQVDHWLKTNMTQHVEIHLEKVSQVY